MGERRMLDFSLSNAFLSLLDTEHFHDSTPETSKDKLPLGSSLISPEPIHLGLFSLLIHLPQSRQARGKECLKSSLHSACQVACLDKSFIHQKEEAFSLHTMCFSQPSLKGCDGSEGCLFLI